MNIDRELAVYKLFTILLVKVLKLSCNEIKLFQVANTIVCQNVLTEMPKASHIVCSSTFCIFCNTCTRKCRRYSILLNCYLD